jgi:type IV pilus assembly protein PilA
MKKMNNKGFSLVELIIVIAIMAILAGAIAPALIRYIDKSRKSNDVTSAKAIVTAVETALSDNDTANEALCNTSIKLDPSNNTITKVALPQVALNSSEESADTGSDFDTASACIMETLKKVPGFKYKKAGADFWVVTITDKEIVTCYAASANNKGVLLAPDGNLDDYDADSAEDGTITLVGENAGSSSDSEEE